jgi:hypothetical protein
MTPLYQQADLQAILRKLDSVQIRRKMLRLLMGLTAVITVALAALLAAAPAAGYWPDQPPALLRWLLLGGIGLLWVAAAGWYIVRALIWRQNPAQTARFVELFYESKTSASRSKAGPVPFGQEAGIQEKPPELHNDLINSVLLAEDPHQVSPELVQMAIHEAARRAGRLDINRSVSLRDLRKWGIALGLAALLLAAMFGFQGKPMKRGLLAIFAPTRYVPTEGTIRILDVQPGDATRFAGEQVTIEARVDNPGAKELAARVLLAGASEPRPMIAGLATASPGQAGPGNATFTCSLGVVDQDVEYAVRIGDTRWPLDKPYYRLTVIKRVEVKGLDLQYNYLPYTGMKSKTVTNADGAIEAPMGTQVAVKLRLSANVPLVSLEMQGGSTLTMIESRSEEHTSESSH